MFNVRAKQRHVKEKIARDETRRNAELHEFKHCKQQKREREQIVIFSSSKKKRNILLYTSTQQ